MNKYQENKLRKMGMNNTGIWELEHHRKCELKIEDKK